MLNFRRRTWLERIYRLWPPYRRMQDALLEDAICRLMADPDMPCVIDGVLIPNGRGKDTK